MRLHKIFQRHAMPSPTSRPHLSTAPCPSVQIVTTQPPSVLYDALKILLNLLIFVLMESVLLFVLPRNNCRGHRRRRGAT